MEDITILYVLLGVFFGVQLFFDLVILILLYKIDQTKASKEDFRLLTLNVNNHETRIRKIEPPPTYNIPPPLNLEEREALVQEESSHRAAAAVFSQTDRPSGSRRVHHSLDNNPSSRDDTVELQEFRVAPASEIGSPGPIVQPVADLTPCSSTSVNPASKSSERTAYLLATEEAPLPVVLPPEAIPNPSTPTKRLPILNTVALATYKKHRSALTSFLAKQPVDVLLYLTRVGGSSEYLEKALADRD